MNNKLQNRLQRNMHKFCLAMKEEAINAGREHRPFDQARVKLNLTQAELDELTRHKHEFIVTWKQNQNEN